MSKRSQKHGCRIVGHRWETALDFGNALDALLEKAAASGTIMQYDTGRGRSVWFDGQPGKELRELRREIERKLSPFLPVSVR